MAVFWSSPNNKKQIADKIYKVGGSQKLNTVTRVARSDNLYK